jgi:Tol biopolymer transport system component
MRSSLSLALVVLVSGCSGEAPPPAESAATAPERELQRIVWVDRSGTIIGNVGEPQEALSGLEVSPDGERVVARGREAGNDDIYIHEGDTKTRFTFDDAHARHPKWSPNGDRIAYFSYRNGAADLFVRASDGSGEDTPVAAGPMHEYYPDWTPDGETLVFHLHDTDTDQRDLWYAPVDGQSPPVPLVETPYNVGLPRFSPDGNYVAYQAEQDGIWNVFITTFPEGDRSWQISTNGGVWPKWRGEGGELYYFENDELMAVTVALGGEPSFGAPSPLFDTSSVGGWSAPEVSLFNALYGPAPNGARFAIVVR